MDTVQMDLIFKKGIEFNKKEEKEIIKRLSELSSFYGHNYCDILKDINYGKETKVIVKLSYPRFYFGNNAYLINSFKECKEVQKHFVSQLQEDKLLKNIEKIKVTRIDIPFTYMMKKNYYFYNYTNVYKILALVFSEKYRNVRSKSIIDTISRKEETVIYSDTKNISAYNTKITIYNQILNLESKDGKYINIKKILKIYPKLPQRMRIEMSKRINRKAMSLKEFKKYDFFLKYSEKYKEELDKVMFNENLINEIYNQKIKILTEILKEYKKSKGKKFTYENFILDKKEDIYDYEILKEAIKKSIINKKSQENAMMTVRKVFKELEKNDGRITIGVRKILKEIKKTIDKSFREERKELKNKGEWDNCPF